MSKDAWRVAVVPCSGIGKPPGSVSREAAYELCESLRPQITELVALSKLVMGDSASRETVARSPCVAIDGCQRSCASKMVEESGGVRTHTANVMDALRRNRGLKVEGIAELNDAGKKLARLIAEELVEIVDAFGASGVGKGAPHG